ncbi:hypothetical protein HRbin16_02069 [bacterium HR16]|nr:hypothetical protein HRbin16_02069 [bacterium HR16]
MKKEVSPVTAAIVIVVVLAILAFVGWRYFFAEPAVVPIPPGGRPPVGGPGIPPAGMAPGGQPGMAAPGAPQGQPGTPAAPQ